MTRKFLAIVCLTGLLTACESLPQRRTTTGTSPAATPTVDTELDISVLSEEEAVTAIDHYSLDQRQFLADLLFEGLQALDADRLLTPAETSAYSRFQRVLAYDPENAIALQGLQDIASRYLELSLQASRRGLFAEASTMLENARFVDPAHPELAAAWITLQAEINSGDLFFDLDNNEVAQRSESVQRKLAEIARQARDKSASFLITSPNDEHARWMFSVMREAVEGYRLRGNIELARRTSVRLRIPQN